MLLALIVPGLGLSGELPGGFPRHVMHEGIIDGISRPRMTVSIGDRLFYFTGSTRIEMPDGYQTPPSTLEEGQRVGCNYVLDDSQRRLLTEIWIRDESHIADR
jgi:hypothetical protein